MLNVCVGETTTYNAIARRNFDPGLSSVTVSVITWVPCKLPIIIISRLRALLSTII